MNILISNDDGINSKALKSLVLELSKIANIYVVAPDCERSGYSHHFNYKGRLRIEEKELQGAKQAFAFWGTPCDCIHAGLLYIIKDKIDLVVSGINKGCNAGSDVIYSGTIAAAREGFLQKTRSIAISFGSFEDRDYTDAASIAREIIEEYVKEPYNGEYFLNVNIPDLPKDSIKGIRVCNTSGRIVYNEDYSYEEEFGVKYLRIGEPILSYDFDLNNTDIEISSLQQGYITITALFGDQINHKYYLDLKKKWDRNR